jgi:hypothetical protein
VRAALAAGAAWLWLMDDDCEPAPDALAALLAAPRAAAPGTAVLAPVVTTADGDPLPLNRGWLRRRWFISPLVGLSERHLAAEEIEVDHVSLVGPLVPAAVAARTDPPRREFFIWWDDLEWVARLRRSGGVYVIPASRVVHKDERPLTGGGLRVRWRDFVHGPGFAAGWKRAYGLRNIVHCGRREGFLTPARAVAFTTVAAARALVEGPPRLRALRLTLAYASDGWRGRFLNVPPERWRDLAEHPRPRAFIAEHALSYGSDVSSEVLSIGRERARPEG